jgi:hypothetical protein
MSNPYKVVSRPVLAWYLQKRRREREHEDDYFDEGGGGVTGASFFAPGTVPTTTSSGDPAIYTLGMRFHALAACNVLALKYFKVATDSGSGHIGLLYGAPNTLMVQKNYDESAAGWAASAGWQMVELDTPIPLTAGADYIVSVYHPSGDYGYVRDFFTAGPITNGNIVGIQGLFTETPGSPPAAPSNDFAGTCYYPDVIID